MKKVSGIPFDPRGASAWKIVFLTLLLVVFVYGVLYVHYIKMPKYDDWVPISRLNVLRKSIAFARFDNRQADEENERVAVGIEFNNDADGGKIVEQNVTDFNNPLYEGGRANEASTSTSNDKDIDLVETSVHKIGDDDHRAIDEVTANVDLIDVNLNQE